MASPSLIAVRDDSPMNNSSPGPRAVGPRRGVRSGRSRSSTTSPRTRTPSPGTGEACTCGSRAPIPRRSRSGESSAMRALCRARNLGKERPAHARAGRDRPAPPPARADRTALGNDGGVGDHVKSARATRKSVEELAGRNTVRVAWMTTYRDLTDPDGRPGRVAAGDRDQGTPVRGLAADPDPRTVSTLVEK